MFKKKKKAPVGSYTDFFDSGMKYHGKGTEKRAKQSGKKIEREYDDEFTNYDFIEEENDINAFIAEYERLKKDASPGSDTNYNIYQSPGKKYKEKKTKL